MWLPNVGLQNRNLHHWKQEKVTKSSDSEIVLFRFFFLAEPCGLQDLSFPPRYGVLALKAPSPNTGQPWNSQKISSYYRHITHPPLWSLLLSPSLFPFHPHHARLHSVSWIRHPYFHPQGLCCSQCHGQLCKVSLRSCFLLIRSSVIFSKKKSLLCFTIYAMACFCRATSKLILWCLPERTYGCWNGLVCVFSCPESNSQIRPQPL